MYDFTTIQSDIVAKLEKKGFRINLVSTFDDGETAFMSKRAGRATTHLVEVDPAGLCNGQPFTAWLSEYSANR